MLKQQRSGPSLISSSSSLPIRLAIRVMHEAPGCEFLVFSNMSWPYLSESRWPEYLVYVYTTYGLTLEAHSIPLSKAGSSIRLKHVAGTAHFYQPSSIFLNCAYRECGRFVGTSGRPTFTIVSRAQPTFDRRGLHFWPRFRLCSAGDTISYTVFP